MTTLISRARPLLVAGLAAIVILGAAPVPAQTQKQLSDAYSEALKKHRTVDTTLDHDVDVKGKMLDLAKTFVDKTGIGIDKWDNIKNGVMSGVELWEAEGKTGGMTEADIMRFIAKTALPYASDAQFKKLNLSDETIAWIKANAANVTDAGAAGAGTAAGGGSWEDVGKELVAGGIDALCPQCAIGRRVIALAVEGGKAVEAWVQDEAVAMEFARFENESMIPVGVLAGQRMLLTNAKAVMMQYTATEPTEDEVIAFVQDQFRRWKAEKDRKATEAAMLEKARQDFLDLASWDRNAFGKDADAQADAYSRAVLDTYRDLMAYATPQCIFDNGHDGILRAATFLVRKQALPVLEYRAAFKNQLRSLGCIEKLPEMDADTAAAKKDHIIDRLARLDYDKLKLVLDHMEVTPPRSLYECMCAAARYHSSSAASVFSPEQYLQPYDERYSCHQPGPPCIVAGNGCTRHPLPSDPEIWKTCMQLEQMPGGERLDDMLLRLFEQGR